VNIMIRQVTTIFVMSLSLVLMGCEGQGGMAGMGPNQTVGMVGGAAAGGLLGAAVGNNMGHHGYKKHYTPSGKKYYTSHHKHHHNNTQLLMAGGGALLGGLLGGMAGKQMDDRDRLLATNSAQSTLNYGTAHHWRDPVDGMHGRSNVVPSSQGGTNCRTLHSDVYDNHGRRVGSEQKLYCPDSRGNWKAK
jgi:surface antigen